MKKSIIKIFLFVFVFTLTIHISFTSNFLILNSSAFEEEFEPEYGPAPVIDGQINESSNEWINATKEEIDIDDLPIEMWVMQNNSDLYILIILELEYPKENIILGILISESSSDDDDDFVDAKFVQFSELNEDDQEIEYLDYYIDDNDYKEDDDEHGDGAAELDDNEIICEFRIPVNNSDAKGLDEDVLLDNGEDYAFKIVYGEGVDYPDDFIKNDTILISIEYPPKTPELEPWETVLFVLSIIAFITIGVFYGFYIYKIFRLKGKIKRIRK